MIYYFLGNRSLWSRLCIGTSFEFKHSRNSRKSLLKGIGVGSLSQCEEYAGPLLWSHLSAGNGIGGIGCLKRVENGDYFLHNILRCCSITGGQCSSQKCPGPRLLRGLGGTIWSYGYEDSIALEGHQRDSDRADLAVLFTPREEQPAGLIWLPAERERNWPSRRQPAKAGAPPERWPDREGARRRAH